MSGMTNKIQQVPNLAMTKLFLEPTQRGADAVEASVGKAKANFIRGSSAAFFEAILGVMSEEGIVFAEWVDADEFTVRPAPVHELDE
jgi:hypothetical protein